MPGFLRSKVFWIITIVVLVLVTVLIFVSGANSAPAATAPVVSNQPVEIVWWTPYGDEVYSDIINDFKKLTTAQGQPVNTNVNVRIVKIDLDKEDYYRKLVKSFLRGNGPDIFTLRNDDIPAYLEFITPMSGVYNLPDSQILADYQTSFVDLVVKETVVRGQVFAVTPFVDNLQLYYNRNILSQAGIPNPPETWIELEKQLDPINKLDANGDFSKNAIALGTGTLTKGGDANTDYNISNFHDILLTFIMQNGGDVYDRKEDKVTLGGGKNQNSLSIGDVTDNKLIDIDEDTDPGFTAIKYYKRFSDLRDSLYSWNTDQKLNVDRFLEGDLAYYIGYSSFKKVIQERQNRLNYEISALPQLDSKVKKTYGSYTVSALNKSLQDSVDKNPADGLALLKLQKAREFMYYLASESAVEKFNAKTQTPSSHKKVIEKQLQGDVSLRIFAQGALYADNYYKPDVQKIEDVWGKMLYLISLENKPVKDAYSDLVKEYSIIVRQEPEFLR